MPSLTTELNHQPLNKPPWQPLSSSPKIHPQPTTATIITVLSAQLRWSSLTHACTSMGTRREPPCAQTNSESVFAHPHLRSPRTVVVILLIELHRRAKPPIITTFISHFKSQQSRRHHISPPPSAALPSRRSNSPPSSIPQQPQATQFLYNHHNPGRQQSIESPCSINQSPMPPLLQARALCESSSASPSCQAPLEIDPKLT